MRWIFENLWMKLLALLIGAAIWLHVATEKIYNYELTVPVTRIDLRNHYTLASQPPDSVRLVVAAKGKQLLRSTWQQQGARINATKLSAGDYTLNLSADNVSLVNTSKSISIDEVRSPATIEVTVDVEASVDLPITPLVTVTPDEGYAISGKFEVIPPRAQLTGPKTVIRNLKGITTGAKELNGLRNSTSVYVPVVAPAGYRMKVDPDSVLVKIQVVPVKTRVYDNLPIVVYNVPPGVRVATSPARTQVEITGPPDDMDLLNRISLTASVDFRARSSIGYAPLKIDCPSNFHVKRKFDDSVRVLSSANANSGN